MAWLCHNGLAKYLSAVPPLLPEMLALVLDPSAISLVDQDVPRCKLCRQVMQELGVVIYQSEKLTQSSDVPWLWYLHNGLDLL